MKSTTTSAQKGLVIKLCERGWGFTQQLRARSVPDRSKKGCVGLGLDDEAGDVDLFVDLAERGDGAFSTEGGGAEVDEEHLVFVVMDLGVEARFHRGFFDRSEVALKDGVL